MKNENENENENETRVVKKKAEIWKGIIYITYGYNFENKSNNNKYISKFYFSIHFVFNNLNN